MAKSLSPIIAALAYVAWALLLPTQADIKPEPKELDTHRLPRDVIPLHYDILFNLGGQASYEPYQGMVGIKFQVVGQSIRNKLDKIRTVLDCFKTREALSDSDDGQCELNKFAPNQIVVHVDRSILLKSVEVYKLETGSSKDKKLKIKGFAHDRDYQMLVITLDKKLKPGSLGRLEFEFDLWPRDNLRGIDKRTYDFFEASSGRTQRRFIASQFQPSDARLVLPCFDEPEFKATFNLSLIHSVNERALSNTPVLERTELEKGKSLVLTKFKQTPLMSIHMLAFTVGDYDYLERQQVGKSLTTVRVYTMPGQKRAAEFALEVACKSLLWMEEYTNINYPLDKFDIVAINDHDKDNYESWGLVFIRSNLTLFDEETLPVLKISTAINVAHVVAHQWFGNLITVDWWTQIWITEGIAAHKGFEIVQELYPDYGSEYFARLATFSSVLDADSDRILSSNVLMPSDSDMKTSEEILSVFNVNGYMKSASLFQLIKNDLGRDQFKRSLQVLLEKNAYGSINMADLSGSIQEATGRGSDYLTKFTSQLYRKSYPIVYVDIFEADDGLILFQDNVYAEELGLSCEFGDATNEHKRERSKWPNINMGRLGEPSWFNVSNRNHWVKLNPNPDLSTYFRVKYDSNLLIRNMKLAIEQKHLSAMDRSNILDDAIGLVLSGNMTPKLLKQLLAHYSQEDHGAVILVILKAGKVLSQLKRADKTPSPAVKALLAMYDRYGFEAPQGNGGQSFIDMRAQMATLSTFVHSRNPDVIEKALKKFDSHDGVVPEIHLREPIYTAVVLDGNQSRLDKLMARLHETNSHDEQIRLIEALALSKDMKVLERLTKWIIESRLTRETKQLHLSPIYKSLDSLHEENKKQQKQTRNS